MSNMKPKQPPCEGPQFADSPSGAFNGKDNYLSVTNDQYNNEMAEDRTMHDNATPQHSNPLYQGRHYSDDFKGGYSNYGTSVSDKGQSPSKQETAINVHRADRGKES
jgi:hypothetical protein